MSLISKTAMVKWNGANKKHFESKKYTFTKMKDEFEVKIEDLSLGSRAVVQVKCDECGEIIKNINWVDYKRYVHDDGTYYCVGCAKKLYGSGRARITKLKNSLSFKQWCINNDKEDVLNKWDTEMNKCTSDDVSYTSNGFNHKGYYFKCLDHPEHESELHNLGDFTKNKKNNILCRQCTLNETEERLRLNLEKYSVKKKDYYKPKEKVDVTCPNCGYIKHMVMRDFTKCKFSCPKCADGISYPEKIMFSVLSQLGIKFLPQLTKTTFKWCMGFKYDFYIIDYNYIIETHGAQHYKEQSKGSNFKRKLQEEQDNDKEKQELALSNKISEYIIVDCRMSRLKYIKNNILRSALSKLFDLSNIDWIKCGKDASISLVKTACDLWNSGMQGTLQISKVLKINRVTVSRYLSIGAELKMCDYNAQEEGKKNLDQIHKVKRFKKIICINTLEIFNNDLDANLKYNIKTLGSIKCCCRMSKQSAGIDPITHEELRWMYYEDYIKDGIKFTNIKPILRHRERIICINTMEIFDSIIAASSKYNIDKGDISKCCSGKYKSAGKHPDTKERMKWMFYKDYLKLQSTAV